MEPLFTPKQVGEALGVSESSVKRWCDCGRVRAAKTVGGHRKLLLSSVVQLIREMGHPIPKPEILGLVGGGPALAADVVRDRLYAALIAGEEAVGRELLLGCYQRGMPITELGDTIIGPVMGRVGDNWENETIRVHHERRASAIVIAVLHELRRWIEPAPADAPLALCATAQRDFAESAIRLVELVLLEAGWQTAMAGAGLPLEEIAAAIEERDPRLVCVSATHLEDADRYVGEHNATFGDQLLAGRRLVVGGGALADAHVERLRCDLFARTLADFEAFLAAQPAGG